MTKKVHDFRGRQSNIFRLKPYLWTAIVHLMSYRVLMPTSIVYGFLVLLSLVFPSLGIYVKAITAVVWILFTPQIFALIKGISLSLSGGLAFGHLNESYKELIKFRYHRNITIYLILPYAVLALWLAGFIMMLVWWPT